MKTTPSLIAGLTASAALVAGVLLAAEDRALFEPQHAMLADLADPVGTGVSPAATRLDAHRLLPSAAELRAHDGPRRAAQRAGTRPYEEP